MITMTSKRKSKSKRWAETSKSFNKANKEGGTARVEKHIATPIKHRKGIKNPIRKSSTRTLTTEKSRVQYVNEFLYKKRSELIERIVRTNTPNLHRKLIGAIRKLSDTGAITVTVEEQIKFNSDLEWGFRMINAHTGKNIWIRQRNSPLSTTSFSVYYTKNEIIKDGDKAKLRAYIVKLKKEEMMERYARK